MKADKIVIGPLIGLGGARDEIARRALTAEPKTPHSTAEERVVAELDKLTAYETCCVLGSLRNYLDPRKDIPLSQLYELSVRNIVCRYQEMVNAQA